MAGAGTRVRSSTASSYSAWRFDEVRSGRVPGVPMWLLARAIEVSKDRLAASPLVEIASLLPLADELRQRFACPRSSASLADRFPILRPPHDHLAK